MPGRARHDTAGGQRVAAGAHDDSARAMPPDANLCRRERLSDIRGAGGFRTMNATDSENASRLNHWNPS
jgi:hypothetical protein